MGYGREGLDVMYRVAIVGVVIGVVAAACSPAPSTEPPPSTLTTTSTTTAPTTSTTTTTQPRTTTTLFGEPVDLVAYPPAQAVGERVEVCAAITGDADPVFTFETEDSAHSTTISQASITQAGEIATCWAFTLPTTFVERIGSRTTRTAVTTGDHRVTATLGDQVIAVGMVDVTKPSQEEVVYPSWGVDRLLVGQPTPTAVSNAHMAGFERVVVHGDLAGVVDVALPATTDDYSSDRSVTHLWSNPNGAPSNEPYQVFSDAGGAWIYRDFDFEGGEQFFVDKALASDRPPAMTSAMSLAWRSMNHSLVPYLMVIDPEDPGSESGFRPSNLSLYDPSNEHTYTIKLWEDFSGDGQQGEWVFEPRDSGDYHATAEARNGVYVLSLSVLSEVSEGDGWDGVAPPLLVSEEDLVSDLERIIEGWESLTEDLDALLTPEQQWASFMRSVVRNADGRLNGPFTAVDWVGETEPAPNQIPVVADDGTWPWVTFYPAPEATERLGPDTTIDLAGSRAVFVAPDASWFFCLDTGFSVGPDTPLSYTRALAAEVCALP